MSQTSFGPGHLATPLSEPKDVLLSLDLSYRRVHEVFVRSDETLNRATADFRSCLPQDSGPLSAVIIDLRAYRAILRETLWELYHARICVSRRAKIVEDRKAEAERKRLCEGVEYSRCAVYEWW